MTHRIFRSILFAATAVMLLALAVIFGVMYEYSSGIQKRQLSDELGLAASAVTMSGRGYLESLGQSDSRLTWIASDGSVIYDTKSDSRSLENHSDREEFKEAIETGYGECSRYSSTLTETTDYIAKKLEDGSVLRISESRASVLALALGMLHPMIVIFVLAFILSAFLASGMSKRIVNPLGKIDLDHPLDNDAYEELAPFLARINRQNHKINEQLAELKRRTDEFDQITGSMNEGLVLLNDRGIVISINPAAKKVFGCDDCRGKDFLTIDRERVMSEAVGKAMRDGKASVENEKDGRVRRFDISRIESGGKVIGAVILAFDVTDSAFAERNRREFTANVSHELKTPLQTIIGSAELIENGFVKPEDMPRFIGHIRREAARLVTLIEDIIRLSQLDEGVDLPREDTDIHALAEEAVGTLSESAKAKNVTLEVHGGGTTVFGVRRLLYEIVYNLCDNAIRYNEDGGRVDIMTLTDDDGAKLIVKDTGIGIPPEHQGRIFERFYRVDKSHSKQSGGTGLGLSIVKHAAQYHGAEIKLESVPGEGSTFTVKFPKGVNSERTVADE